MLAEQHAHPFGGDLGAQRVTDVKIGGVGLPEAVVDRPGGSSG
jgi:hypothetical protein